MFWRKKNENGEDYDVSHVKDTSNDEVKVVWANQQGSQQPSNPTPPTNAQPNVTGGQSDAQEKEGFWKRKFKKLGISKDDTKTAAIQLYDKYSSGDSNEVKVDDLPSVIDDFFKIVGVQSSVSPKQIAWVMNLLNIQPGNYIDLKLLKRVLKLVSGAKGYFGK